MPDNPLFKIAFYMIVVWIVGVCILFVILLRKYTFGDWTKENPNPYRLETFGMPRGIFRGIITLSVLFIVMLLEILNLQIPFLHDGKLLVRQFAENEELFLPEERYKELMVAFQMILAFYFGSKVAHHITKADERKTQEVAQSVVAAEASAAAAKPTGFEQEGAAG